MVASTRVHQLLRSGVRIARDCFSSAFTSFLSQTPNLWTQSRNCELARDRCQSLLHEPTTLLPDSLSSLLLPLAIVFLRLSRRSFPQAPKLWTQSRNCELARNRCQSLLHEPTTLLPDSESSLLLPLSSISNCRQLQHRLAAHYLAEPYPIKGASFSLTSLTT